MCLIVDNNIARRVFVVRNDLDFGEIARALFIEKNHPAKLVYERRLLAEYRTNAEVALRFLELVRAQRAVLIPDEPIQAEIEVLSQAGLCQSNDLHLLALARVSKARLLCSLDQNLHTDFCNPAIIHSPRGKVYQNTSHNHLLRKYCRVQSKVKSVPVRTSE